MSPPTAALSASVRLPARVIAIYHSVSPLRNPGAEKQVWEDMKTAASLLGITLRER